MYQMFQLEIPYNFDKQLITGLKLLDQEGFRYHSIYLPPFFEDYKSAKRYYVNPQNYFDMKHLLSQSRSEYEEHVKLIHAAYPDKLMLLLQQPDEVLSEETLQYYLDLGFTKFCVNSKEQAKQIKCKYPDAKITCSIVHNISKEELESDSELAVFDAFVLPHCFNRDIESIKALPKTYAYVLLVNSSCSAHCTGEFHWLADQEAETASVRTCPKAQFPHSWKDIVTIRPMDIPIFTPYIPYFKLLGREHNTDEILRDIILYSSYYDCEPDESLYTKR